MLKINYEELLKSILNECSKKGKAIEVKDLKSVNINTDIKCINNYFRKYTNYKNYQDYCRRNGYSFEGDIKINDVIKPSTEVTLEEIKVLFLEYEQKYGIYPNSLTCMNENRDNLPTWNTIKNVMKQNNFTLNDFFNYIGDEKSIKPDTSKYMEYVQILKDQYETNGHLNQNDYLGDYLNVPNYNWFIKHCPNKEVKTYNDFLEWIGIKPNTYISKDMAIKIIYNMQEKLDRPLQISDFNNPSYDTIGIRAVNRYWGTMNKMKKELGLQIIQEDMNLKKKSKETMLEDLQNLIHKLGRLPVTKDFKDNAGEINSAVSYHKHFGGINNAILQLGYIPNKKAIALFLSNDEIKKIYKDFIKDNGFVPSYEFCKKVYHLPSPRTVVRRFSCSWNDFIKLLGFEPNDSIVSNCTFKAKDGTKCLSSAECLIHNILLNKNIKNLQKEVFYKDILDDCELCIESGYKRFDWTFVYNEKTYMVEYFGIMSDENYRIRHDEKIKLIKNDNKENCFIAIYPKDLKYIENKFNFII